MRLSRRAILAASAGVAMLAGCTSEQSAPQEDTTETMTDRTPRHFDDDGNMTSPVRTEDLQSGESNGTLVSGPGEVNFDTIQAAIDAITQNGSGLAENEVLALPHPNGAWSETVTLTGAENPSCTTLRGIGKGQATHIEGSGDHTITMDSNDPYIESLWVDQIDDSGDYDAVHITNRESKIEDIAVDYAPRHCVFVNGGESRLTGLELGGAGSDAIHIGTGGNHTISDIQIKSTPDPAHNGITYQSASSAEVSGAHIEDVTNRGMEITGNSFTASSVHITGSGAEGLYVGGGGVFNNIQATIWDAGADGAYIGGDEGTYALQVGQATGDALRVAGSDNAFVITTRGDVNLDSGTSTNIVTGRVQGTLTDDGTRNLINGRGTNDGDPTSTGDWNGNAGFAESHNALVEDTANDNLYRAVGGSWAQVN